MSFFSNCSAYVHANPGTSIAITTTTAAVVAALVTYFVMSHNQNKVIKVLPRKEKDNLKKLIEDFKKADPSCVPTKDLHKVVCKMVACNYSDAMKPLVNKVSQAFGALHAHFTGEVVLDNEQLQKLQGSLNDAFNALLNYEPEKKSWFGKKEKA